MAENFEIALSDAVDDAMVRAERLFTELEDKTKDGPGVTRVAWGEGEQIGHDMCEVWAKEMGLEISGDVAGNLYMTLPGKNREAPVFITGSHMDTVPCGGNYDGAAGVVSGLAVIQAFLAADILPVQDTVVMAIRAEEGGSWFSGRHGGHLGSRAVLGRLWKEELHTAYHNYFEKSAHEVIKDAGFDPDAIANEPRHLDPKRIKGYCELHIEQGPILLAEGKSVGVVTGIRGNRRVRDGKVYGEYNHGGATPQSYRKDAVLAASEFLNRFEEVGLQKLADGKDLVFNPGIMHTDPNVNGLSKVCGEVDFTLDMRSEEVDTLEAMKSAAEDIAAEISECRGVTIDLGGFSASSPTILHKGEQQRMHAGCQALGIDAIAMASGGGHDAAEFQHEGVPSSMVFIRNDKGSHNPDEAMTMEDFCDGTKVLAWMMATA
ncbi:MAG: Zn-dependent hydrolase [Rhodospirillaceae bacterium]|nr:Zn-dependent hydrolase [Rhodospirillaceae bacterium]